MTQHRASITEADPAENRKWLRSPLLGRVPGLVHAFSTRDAGDMAAEPARRSLGRALGARRVRALRQVHGVAVAAAHLQGRPEADAWAGVPEAGELLAILTADCLPVLLCHPATRTLGLAHAGWRGAAAGVVPRTLEAMGVPAGEVLAALGPCIRRCCYQVGEDVAAAVGPSAHLVPWEGAAGRYRLDLAGLARSQLEGAGVAPEHIDPAAPCTADRTDLFFSYRREGSTGRMAALLGWSA